MKIIILLALTLTAITAVQKQSAAAKAINEELSKIPDQQWTNIITNLAQLSLQTGGPIEDLVKAIEDVIQDLQDKRTRSQAAFALRSTRHEDLVKDLEVKIQNAKSDVATSQETIEEIMLPNIKMLEQVLAENLDDIKKAQEYMESQGIQRESEKKDYEQRIQDHEEALKAIKECIDMLNHEDLNLVQIEEMQGKVRKVKSETMEGTDSILVQTLAKLANSKYADKDLIAEVIQLLKELENNLLISSAKETALEQKAQENYDEDMKNTQNNIVQWEIKVDETNGLIEKVKEQIEDLKEFIIDRTDDFNEYTDLLESENNAFNEAENNHKELQDKINSQEESCEKALEIIKGAGFADYIEQRLGKESLVGEKQNGVEFSI